MGNALFGSSRHAIALGLGFVAVLSLAAIPPAAVLFPALGVVVLLFAPGGERPRMTPAVPSSSHAVVMPTMSDSLLSIALGATIGLAYLLLVLQL